MALLLAMSSSSLMPVTVTPSPPTLKEAAVVMGRVTVPVNVGLALSALVPLATAMLLNSVSISVPLTILAGLPETKASLVAKFVVLV